jgi:hypothetical protein
MKTFAESYKWKEDEDAKACEYAQDTVDAIIDFCITKNSLIKKYYENDETEKAFKLVNQIEEKYTVNDFLIWLKTTNKQGMPPVQVIPDGLEDMLDSCLDIFDLYQTIEDDLLEFIVWYKTNKLPKIDKLNMKLRYFR